MDEAQRIAYLKHMGVEQYYPGMFWSERKRLSFLLQHKTFMTLRVLSSCLRRHDRQSRRAVSLMQSPD